MEVASKKISFKDKLRLIPFSDVHLGSRASNEKKFDALIKWVLEKPDTYMIGLGDYADLIIRQDLKRFSGKVAKEELMDMLDSMLNEQRNLVVCKLKPVANAGKLLGLGEGNHEDAVKRHHSYDILKDICKELNVPYLGYSFFYRLTVKKKSRQKTKNVIIYGHHGWGSSRRGGYAMNKRELIMEQYDADIVLFGHDHHKFGRRFIRLGVTSNGETKIIKKPVIIAATGSYLKTIVHGDTTYAEKAGYPPNDIGVVRIDIDLQGRDGDLDMHISE